MKLKVIKKKKIYRNKTGKLLLQLNTKTMFPYQLTTKHAFMDMKHKDCSWL